jgi:hypothetical protein
MDSNIKAYHSGDKIVIEKESKNDFMSLVLTQEELSSVIWQVAKLKTDFYNIVNELLGGNE